MNREELGEHLRTIVDAFWKNNNQPILISLLPDYLKVNAPGGDYKAALGSGSLKTFAKSSGVEFGYRVIEHPTQKAKVGLVPQGVDYSFPTEEVKVHEISVDSNSKSATEGIAFMKILAKFSDEDLDKISIPISVLAKLFR